MSNIEKIRQYIERRIALAEKCAEAACEKNLHSTLEANELLIRQYKSLLTFIDSLPEEEPSKDLEEAAEIYCHDMGLDAEDNGTAWEETKDDFIAGAKWMKERMIKDAAEIITVQGSLTEPEFVKQRVIFLKED